jgi:plastocyanin
MARSVYAMMLRSSILVVIAVSVVGCGRGPAASSDRAAPLSPSPVAAVTSTGSSAPTAAVQGRQDVLVNMHDACDPATFNAALGPGTCLRAGGVQFNQFIAELTRLGSVGAWHFAPPNANVQVGQSFAVSNRGGEVHTFTEVAQFGGGIVPRLNELAHVPTVAPECAALDPDDFVAPGTTYREDVEHAGTLKFQCCIHPWMRLEANASAERK